MKVLFCGDAVVKTGFSRCTHAACDALHAAGHDVAVVGVNYWGDPHPYPYPIFAAANPLDQGNDVFGVGRLAVLTYRLKPDVVVLLTDPWNVQGYLKGLAQMPADFPHPIVVGWLAVDAKNQRGVECNDLDHVVAWTQFGVDELVRGGYEGTSSIVPLGVDHRTFFPREPAEARRRVFPSTAPADAFVVGVVGRNQPRKRIDLVLQYFAEWIHWSKIENAHLYLHVAPTGERGIDIPSVALYHGLKGKVMLSAPDLGYGIDDDGLPLVYSACDVFLTTTQGEGWGLPVLEAMACGTPCIVPDWSGLGSWVGDAAVKVPCTEIALSAPLNGFAYTIGGIANKATMIQELEAMYRSEIHRETYRRRGLKLAQTFSWERTGQEFRRVLERVMAEQVLATVAPGVEA